MPETPPFLDTSVVVRYLTAEPPDMAERARRLIETETHFQVTETALVETAHVLRTGYGLTREEVADLLSAFVSRVNVTVYGIDTRLTVAALDLSRPSGRVSVPDGLIWAAARTAGATVVYTFDERFPAQDIEVRIPA